MKSIRTLGVVTAIGAVTLACGEPPPAPPAETAPATTNEAPEGSELARVLDRMMASPQLEAEEGFSARLLLAPGQLYDPLFMHEHAGAVWVNDDGGQEDDKGGQIVALDSQGAVSPVLPVGRLLPVTGFDIAPASFSPYEGQVFTIAQPEPTYSGAEANHVIQRIDVSGNEDAEVFCTLPAVNTGPRGAAGWGIDARFGPEGSAFAGKFFAIAAFNNTVYQISPDGRCTPFVTLDDKKWGRPQGLAFSLDGQHLLVSASSEQYGSVARVRPNGALENKPLVRAEKLQLRGLAYAPEGFGEYGGQLFIAANRRGPSMQQTHAPPSLGEVYRVTAAGELERIASGFRYPHGLYFGQNRLWVSDINGDFIAGRRELPDGFIAEITPAQMAKE